MLTVQSLSHTDLFFLSATDFDDRACGEGTGPDRSGTRTRSGADEGSGLIPTWEA
jgi:hypothetical protein